MNSHLPKAMVAEVGFEPHDLRVMSPTSYQAALPRDMKLIGIRRGNCSTPPPLHRKMVPEAGIEPVREKISRDFKSRASANSAIPAYRLPCCLSIIARKAGFVKPFYEISSFSFSTVFAASVSFARESFFLAEARSCFHSLRSRRRMEIKIKTAITE